jgi:signal transduction histidine kinase
MATTDTDLTYAASASDHFPLSRRDLGLVVAFWMAYAVLSIASRLLDRGGVATSQLSGIATVALVESLCWALLTPPIFLLTARLDTEPRRTREIVLLTLIGIVIALALGWLGTELRHVLTPFGGSSASSANARVPRVPRSRPSHGGPPIWFGVLNALVLYTGVVAAGLARAYSRRYQLRREQAARREARLEAQLAEARLEALRRQLDPHFLFNTLNTVSALLERDPRGVRRVISRLSELLRHSFEGAAEPEVALRDELALLNRYVEIMQVRFQGRLTVETRVNDQVLDALVPSMMLQPLVENAIRHGVEKITGPGVIEIEGQLEDAVLVLRVRDNGAGVSEASGALPRRGVGIANTIARLEQLYGMAQSFSLARAPGGGSVAEIRIPFHARTGSAGATGSTHASRASQDVALTGGAARVE